MRRPPALSSLFHFPVTGGTAILAIAVTLYAGAGNDISPLLMNGEIRRWQLWRLATATLPHANLFHLVFNLYWLWAFGTLVESIWGSARAMLIVLMLAVGSMGCEFAILRGGIGLSGVGYGLFGLVWIMSRRDGRFADAVDRNTIALFVAWFFICIGLTAGGIMPVANIAHGVGALLGWSITARGFRAVYALLLVLLLTGSIDGATAARPYVNLSHDGVNESMLGYEALRNNDYLAGIRWCRDAVRIEPTNAAAWYNLGVAYHHLKRLPEAADAYRKAAAFEPGNEKYREQARNFE